MCVCHRRCRFDTHTRWNSKCVHRLSHPDVYKEHNKENTFFCAVFVVRAMFSMYRYRVTMRYVRNNNHNSSFRFIFSKRSPHQMRHHVFPLRSSCFVIFVHFSSPACLLFPSTVQNLSAQKQSAQRGGNTPHFIAFWQHTSTTIQCNLIVSMCVRDISGAHRLILCTPVHRCVWYRQAIPKSSLTRNNRQEMCD